MIHYSEALAHILREARPLAPVPRTPVLGQVLAAAIVSGENLPPFDNSAMDGFALRVGASSLCAGSEFDVLGAQAAGDTQTAAQSGAWEIMTGARIPDGLDAVIPVEQIEVLARDGDGKPLRIRLNADVPHGQHIRRCGEDVRKGDAILQAGTRLDAQHLMLLAALGVAEAHVHTTPRVALINTGRELVDDPAQPLASGEIRNSNGPYLARRIEQAGAELVLRQTVTDDPDAFFIAMEQARSAGADLILSTGAVSMGRYDFVPDALRKLGATIHFHKVAIRPGKPLLFATLPNGSLFFGLPGNPASSAVGLRFFVEPALRSLLGLAPEQPLQLPLLGDFRKRPPLRFHLKAHAALNGEGRLQARVLPGQESFRIAPLAHSNCWIVVDADTQELAEGALVNVYGLGHLLGLQLQGQSQ